MAFRIHESVVRGEIDNREKGVVRGRIWLHGREEPMTLELKGNAWPDLAGSLLRFTNPLIPQLDRDLESLASVQRGMIGDLTASRKVRVFDIPTAEAYLMCKRGEKPPEHMANSLYLEWFSQANGRVVIESADYQLEISSPLWRLTPEENAQRARDAAAGMEQFMQQLTEAIELRQRAQKDPEAEWDEHDFERFLQENDARTDKYMELLDKYGHSEEAEAKIAEEMGWVHELTEEETEEERERIAEINRACEEAMNEPPPEPDPHREGIDWIRTEDGNVHHPLQHRCSESAIKVWRECDELGLTDRNDGDLAQFITEFQITAAKLAGALNGIAEGRSCPDNAFTVACLKRALDHLHKAQAGLETLAPRELLPHTTIAESRRELFEIREGILKLMDVYRGRT